MLRRTNQAQFCNSKQIEHATAAFIDTKLTWLTHQKTTEFTGAQTEHKNDKELYLPQKKDKIFVLIQNWYHLLNTK